MEFSLTTGPFDIGFIGFRVPNPVFKKIGGDLESRAPLRTALRCYSGQLRSSRRTRRYVNPVTSLTCPLVAAGCDPLDAFLQIDPQAVAQERHQQMGLDPCFGPVPDRPHLDLAFERAKRRLRFRQLLRYKVLIAVDGFADREVS